MAGSGVRACRCRGVFVFRPTMVTAQLGGAGRVSEEFQYIDPRPLASASVAQVHRAKLRSGEEVVLKVIDNLVARAVSTWAGRWSSFRRTHVLTSLLGLPSKLEEEACRSPVKVKRSDHRDSSL